MKKLTYEEWLAERFDRNEDEVVLHLSDEDLKAEYEEEMRGENDQRMKGENIIKQLWIESGMSRGNIFVKTTKIEGGHTILEIISNEHECDYVTSTPYLLRELANRIELDKEYEVEEFFGGIIVKNYLTKYVGQQMVTFN